MNSNAIKARPSFSLLKDNLRSPSFLTIWLVPFAVYLFLCLLYTLSFMSVPSVCIIFSIFFALAVVVLFLLRKRGPLCLPLAIGGVVAVACGTFLGLYIYDKFAIFPHFYTNSRLYNNVVPSQPSAAVADAGHIVFTSESFVDAGKSVGYITESGHLYCVAPIRDTNGVPQVEFWAVGTGCCAETGKFWCDASKDNAAHAGITVFDNNGFFTVSNKDNYHKAQLKAAAHHRLVTVPDPLFVRWVREDHLNMLSRQYRTKAIIYVVVFSLLILGFLLGIAIVLWKQQPFLGYH